MIIECRLRELGDVKALVVGAFAEHSAADIHTLEPSLRGRSIESEGGSKSTTVGTQLSARQPGTHNQRPCNHASRLSFAGAPAAESPAGVGSAGISDVARLEIHTQAALQKTSFNDT
jgi:hypothetical protein